MVPCTFGTGGLGTTFNVYRHLCNQVHLTVKLVSLQWPLTWVAVDLSHAKLIRPSRYTRRMTLQWVSHNCFKKELSLFIHKLLIVSANGWKLILALSEILGAFHSTKYFGTFETGANDTEISLESFQKVRKLSSSEMQTIQPKITGIRDENPNLCHRNSR